MTTAQLNVKNAFVIDHVDPGDKELSEIKNLDKIKLDIRAKKKALKRKEFDASHPGIAKLRAKLLEGKYHELQEKEDRAEAEHQEAREAKRVPYQDVTEIKEEPAKEVAKEVVEEPVQEVVQPSRVGIGAKW